MVSFFGAFLNLFLGFHFGGFSFDLGSGQIPIGSQASGSIPINSQASSNVPIG